MSTFAVRRSPERRPEPVLHRPAVVWSICSMIAWCATAALLPITATAARLDLWPTSTGPLNEVNHSRTHEETLERIGWDLPSFGMIKVTSGVAEGYYLTGHEDERDWASEYLRAEEDSKLAAVFEFQYRTDLDAYLIMGVSFEHGPGTNEAWSSSRYICVHKPIKPEDSLSNGEVRVDTHMDPGESHHWKFSEHPEGGFLMRLIKESGEGGKAEAGPYFSIPEDVDERNSHSRFASVTHDVAKAARVNIELP